MKKWIFVLIIALVFNHYWNTYAEEVQVCMNCTSEVTSNFCPDCGEANLKVLPALAVHEGYLALKVNYEKNKILAKYDVDIYVDETFVATLKNNESLSRVMILEKGLHEVCVKAGSRSARTMVDVETNTRLSFAIKTHLFSISIKDVETDGTVSVEEQLAYEKAQFIAGCLPIDYERFSRYPEEFKNDQIVLKGKVVSAAENFAGMMKVVVKDNRGNLWIVEYSRIWTMPRILMDDVVEVYGKCKGITTYQGAQDVYPLLPTVSLMYLEIK